MKLLADEILRKWVSIKNYLMIRSSSFITIYNLDSKLSHSLNLKDFYLDGITPRNFFGSENTSKMLYNPQEKQRKQIITFGKNKIVRSISKKDSDKLVEHYIHYCFNPNYIFSVAEDVKCENVFSIDWENWKYVIFFDESFTIASKTQITEIPDLTLDIVVERFQKILKDLGFIFNKRYEILQFLRNLNGFIDKKYVKFGKLYIPQKTMRYVFSTNIDFEIQDVETEIIPEICILPTFFNERTLMDIIRIVFSPTVENRTDWTIRTFNHEITCKINPFYCYDDIITDYRILFDYIVNLPMEEQKKFPVNLRAYLSLKIKHTGLLQDQEVKNGVAKIEDFQDKYDMDFMNMCLFKDIFKHGSHNKRDLFLKCIKRRLLFVVLYNVHLYNRDVCLSENQMNYLKLISENQRLSKSEQEYFKNEINFFFV